MSELYSRPHEYGDSQSDKAALLIAGYGNTVPQQLEPVAVTLAEAGYNIYGYDFSTSVLEAGDPDLLPLVVNGITSDFRSRTGKYTSILPCGVSMGAVIAWEVQKQEHRKSQPGIYAATGTNSADGLFGINPIMTPLRKAFTNKGFTKSDLQEKWDHIHTPPDAGFTVALGGLDIIVQHHSMMKNIRAWRQAGIPIETVHVPFRGHTRTISWYNQNIGQLLLRENQEVHART